MPKYYDIDVSLWRAFLAISETGSITASASSLFRTPSAVSMQIKRLEEMIGKPLFIRHNTGLTLTLTGERLLVYAKKICQLNDEVFHSVTCNEDEVIKLGMPDDYASTFLPSILESYYHSQANVHVEVTCKTSGRLMPLITAGKLDIAITCELSGQPNGTIIGKETLHWIGHPNFRKGLPDCIPLVLFAEGCACRSIALDRLEQSGKSWRIIFSSESNAAVYGAIRAGAGVMVSEAMLIPEGIAILDTVDALPQLPSINIVAHIRSGQPTLATTRLLKHIEAGFKQTSGYVTAYG